MKVRSLLLATLAAIAVHGKALAVDINIGVPNWAAAQVISNIMGKVLTDELGLEIGYVPGTNPVIFEAMDRSVGGIDVHPDVWMPNQKNLVQKYVHDLGTVVLSEVGYTGSAALCVTEATVEKTGVKDIYDLTDPDIARQFDSDGDGKGEIWIGATGWASTTIERVRYVSFGISETFELLEMDEELGIARVRAAAKSGEPIATMCTQPHALWKLADLVMLDEPAYDESKWTMVQPTDDPDWLEKSHIEVAWPTLYVQLAYATRLRDSQPDAAKILERISFETLMVSDFIYQVTELKRDPGDVADEWIEANADRVKGWLAY